MKCVSWAFSFKFAVQAYLAIFPAQMADAENCKQAKLLFFLPDNLAHCPVKFCSFQWLCRGFPHKVPSCGMGPSYCQHLKWSTLEGHNLQWCCPGCQNRQGSTQPVGCTWPWGPGSILSSCQQQSPGERAFRHLQSRWWFLWTLKINDILMFTYNPKHWTTFWNEPSIASASSSGFSIMIMRDW